MTWIPGKKSLAALSLVAIISLTRALGKLARLLNTITNKRRKVRTCP